MTSLLALVGVGLTLPLDFMKVQVQTSKSSVVPSISKMIGLELALGKSITNIALKSLIFSQLEYNKSTVSLVSVTAALATLTTPLDNLLVKLQTQHLGKNISIRNGIESYNHFNTSIFRGWEANIFKATTFAIFLQAGLLMNKTAPDNYFSNIGYIGVGSLLASVVSNPFDLIRVNMQKCAEEGVKEVSGFVDCISHINATSGIAGFYRGFGLYFTRNFLSASIAYSLLALISN